jgi:arginine exporter protein ArgO
MVGHWSADTLWFTLVSIAVSKGRTIFSDSAYRRIMMLCGIFLILFGIFYLSPFIVSS